MGRKSFRQKRNQEKAIHALIFHGRLRPVTSVVLSCKCLLTNIKPWSPHPLSTREMEFIPGQFMKYSAVWIVMPFVIFYLALGTILTSNNPAPSEAPQEFVTCWHNRCVRVMECVFESNLFFSLSPSSHFVSELKNIRVEQVSFIASFTPSSSSIIIDSITKGRKEKGKKKEGRKKWLRGKKSDLQRKVMKGESNVHRFCKSEVDDQGESVCYDGTKW